MNRSPLASTRTVDADEAPRRRLDVRLVPISSDQVEALKSLERALRGLADDFERDIGGAQTELMAGALFRLWSTLDTITELWRAAGEGAIAEEELLESDPEADQQ